MKILAIDSGNTRVKWGIWDGATWTRLGAVGHDELDKLRETLAGLPVPERIVGANVAGIGVARQIEAACAGLATPIGWARPRVEQCGVSNGYTDPGQLGVDRWPALIGAWHRQHGACLVVGAGTATTIDILSDRGEFRGGVILPGLALMKRSLAENTARLPLAQGAYAQEPRSTADAIETGVLHAQAGAIERLFAQSFHGDQGAAMCLISGGAAALVAACLAIPHRQVDHLVLDGLARIAESLT